jgi:uncharacterized protein
MVDHPRKVRLALRQAAWVALATFIGLAQGGPLEDAASAHEHGDDIAAVRLLLPLAEGGDRFAQFALGFIYDTAKGMPRDDTAAAKWYRKAADQGVVGAQYNLGAMYADGHGVLRDYVEAYKWLSIVVDGSAADQDRVAAFKTRDVVAMQMTPEQVARAQKLAREWEPK